MQRTVLLEMQYLAPVQYYAPVIHYKKVCIERYDHFVKSTYRNRCYLAGPDGVQRLSIPLKKGKNQHTVVSAVQVENTISWQRIHWQGLCAIYRRSPYFEFYEEHFAPFYEKQFDFLFDFNLQLMKLVLKLLEAEVEISFTEKYEEHYSDDVLDLRSAIQPKKQFSTPRYQQVFEERTGFQPNMSIADLLFCEGRDALEYLKKVEISPIQ